MTILKVVIVDRELMLAYDIDTFHTSAVCDERNIKQIKDDFEVFIWNNKLTCGK